LSAALVGTSANGGDVKGANNGGNGGDGGKVVLAGATIGGSVSSGNTASIDQENSQVIAVVPVAIQKASTNYNAFAHDIGNTSLGCGCTGT
jgi:hypothetical protein